MGVIADWRTEVATQLGDACDGTNWSVYLLPVESPSPPCYVLHWSDPWMEGPTTPCFHLARLEVRAIGPRIEPDSGMEVLERMVEAAMIALAEQPVRTVSQPAPYIINNIRYQSATLALARNVNVNGGS